MSEKYGFVYIWYDRKHKRFYIGSHWGTENDGYICSSSWMKQGYTHRPEDFKRRILFRTTESKKRLLEEENRWLSMIKECEIKTKYYNLRIHDFGHWSADKDLSLTVSQKLSIAQKGKHRSPKTEIKKGERISIATEFKKGERAHNSGKSLEERYGIEKAKEIKMKMSAAKKNKPSNSPTKFKKGFTPWNKRMVA